jgi:anti-sigma factor RsiW
MTHQAAASSECMAHAAMLDTYLDGELEPTSTIEVETHLAHCPRCRERIAFRRAVKHSLHKIDNTPLPNAAFQARIRAAMAEVAKSDETQSNMARSGSYSATNVRPLPKRYLIPVAVAASFALMFSAKRAWFSPPADDVKNTNATATSTSTPHTTHNANMLGIDGIMEELVSMHAKPLPPEVTRRDEIRRFEPFVGVPVKAPTLPFEAKWEGGRVLPMRDQRAAMLQYTIRGGHRVTIYVFDPSHVNTHATKALRPRMAHNIPVYVGTIRGYNVATTSKQGVGYAFATDLDEPQNIELATATIPQ